MALTDQQFTTLVKNIRAPMDRVHSVYVAIAIEFALEESNREQLQIIVGTLGMEKLNSLLNPK